MTPMVPRETQVSAGARVDVKPCSLCWWKPHVYPKDGDLVTGEIENGHDVLCNLISNCEIKIG